MPSSNDRTINLRLILESAVVFGPSEDMIWTGYPNAKYINADMVPDQYERELLRNTVLKLEQAIREIRHSKTPMKRHR